MARTFRLLGPLVAFLATFATETFQAPGVTARVIRAGVPQIRGTVTSIGSMVGRARRGPQNVAVRCGSFAQWQRIFGDYDPNGYAADAVRAFFDNGGETLYFVRAQASSGGGTNTKALFNLQTAGAVNTIKVEATGAGTDGNGYKVVATKEDTKLGTLDVVNAAGATTVIKTTRNICSKLRVGDQINVTETGPGTIRGFVSRIDDTSIVLTASVTIGVGGFTAAAIVTLESFSLTIYDQGSVLFGPVKGLQMSSLSKANYFLTRINITGDYEIPVTVADLAAATGGLDTRPVNTVASGDMLTTGSEMATYVDADYYGNSGSGTGLYAFDKIKTIRIVAIPGVTGTSGAVAKALVQYCEGREDCHAIISPALSTSVSSAVTYKQDNIGSSRFGAMYYPWIQVTDPLTGLPGYAPPDGYVMGMYARNDRNLGVQKAPAGETAGRLVGAIGVERVLTTSDRRLLYPVNINPIEEITGLGVSVMGSRTLEKSEFEQIGVSRAFTYVATSLAEGTRWTIFEPNNDSTRARARRSVSSFLENEWKKGLLDGATIDEAFYVTCDKSNNPTTIVRAQQMQIDVGINVPDTVENLVINIQHDQRGTAA
jgi:hypothetical protein